jgi:KUP system potassium uptake protein
MKRTRKKAQRGVQGEGGENVPVTLLHNLKHNKVLHHTVLLVRVVAENIPRVADSDGIKARELGCGFWQIEAHFGFVQTPNVPRELGRVTASGAS